MNKIISSYKWKIAHMPLFFVFELNYIMKLRIKCTLYNSRQLCLICLLQFSWLHQFESWTKANVIQI